MERFLANENFPLPSVNILRENGWDIKSVTEECPGITDREVLEIANTERRIILTFDKDYGELIYRYRQTPPPGVVYFHFLPDSPEEPGEILLDLKNQGIQFERKYTVVRKGKVSQKDLK